MASQPTNRNQPSTAGQPDRPTGSIDRQTVLPYSNLPATCLSYDPEAPTVAAKVGRLIEGRAGPGMLVEHIGSTAVPGCFGKGIIDLMLLYPGGELEQAKNALASLGFQPQSGRDPWPESRPMRVGATEHDGRTYQLHVHVLEQGVAEVAQLRAFRDRLRSDRELREAYEAVKWEVLAKGITDGVEYSYAKARFFG